MATKTAQPQPQTTQELLAQSRESLVQVTQAIAADRANLTEIETLLKNPQSNVVSLVQEQTALNAAIAVRVAQVEVIQKRIAALESKQATEAKEARKRELEAFVEGEEAALEPIVARIEAGIEQLSEDLRQAFETAQKYTGANAELYRSGCLSITQLRMPTVRRHGRQTTISQDSFDPVRPEIRAADYAARVEAERQAADKEKAMRENYAKGQRRKEWEFLKKEIPRLEGVVNNSWNRDRERAEARYSLKGYKATFDRLEKEFGLEQGAIA